MLLGGGGHAAAVADLVWRGGGTVVAVSDPGACGVPLLPGVPTVTNDADAYALARAQHAVVIPAIGDARTRLAVLGAARDAGVIVVPVVATTATVAANAAIGDGTVVFEHAHVGPNTVLGEAVIVNTAAVIEHHARLGAAVHVAPGAVVTGAACVGPGALIGAGAVLMPGTEVGAGARVGAGAVVTRAVRRDAVVVGVPAKERS